MGGAVPAVLGFGGASLCAGVAKQDTSIVLRVGLCAAVTAAAWVILVAVLAEMR